MRRGGVRVVLYSAQCHIRTWASCTSSLRNTAYTYERFIVSTGHVGRRRLACPVRASSGCLVVVTGTAVSPPIEPGAGEPSWHGKDRDRLMRTRLASNAGKEEDEKMGSPSDDEDLQASKYRENWINIWGVLGLFEDTTRIPAMRFTDTHPLPSAKPRTTLQVFSAKISGISGGLQFPLGVYGVIAARDCADQKRNLIFSRTRDDCQTITEEDPYLVLTGPSRAILLLDPVFIEVMLKVKGAVECEDKTLNFQAIELIGAFTCSSRMISGSYTSKLSTLKLTLGSMVSSVEATLYIRVLNGLVPSAFSVIASTSSCEETDHGALLLGSCDTTMPLFDDGCVKLSRYVVSVPVRGDLVISLATSEPSQRNEESTKVCFRAMETGRSSRLLQVGSCTMEINVAWSPIALPE